MLVVLGTRRSRRRVRWRAWCVALGVALGTAVAPEPGSAQGSDATASPEWPEITREARPWTRWWWHGSAVTERGLTQALESYARAGFGGVEVTPIYGVHGREAEFIPFLSPQWVDRLAHTLREAERLDVGVDMATGTGWPFGGPWVSDADAPKYVAHRRYSLRSGERLGEPIAYVQEPILRAVGNQIYETYNIYRVPGERLEGTRERPAEIEGRRQIDISELVEPIAANPDLQSLALDQVRFPKPLPLVSLMAYSAEGAALDLTDRVGPDGELDWVAPRGEWSLYAVFQGWHGKQVERAAPGGEGHVIDHFSRGAIQRYLGQFDRAFAERDLGALRGFFNDSYEVDDATGQADWTPEFFDAFEQRRGYDLRRHLPALFGDGDSDVGVRVLMDHRETISDLILETFTREWASWAHRRGALVRNQAHGSPANILDLYAATDIPETEGNDLTRIKFASSAANVSGKRLVGAEAATWLGEHFTSTLADVRRALDRNFVGGVNHIVYHGTAYSPPDAEWPGWLFYAAVHFTPANSWWGDLGALNGYVARVQSFLQKGTADNDVLLYFPAYDRFAERGAGLLQHFDGIARGEESAFRNAAEQMLARGYAYDYVSDRQLDGAEIGDGRVRTGGIGYRAVVVPRARYVPLATMEKLVSLARGGATVILYDGLPGDVPGLGDLEERQARFRAMLDELHFEPAGEGGLREARIGSGRVLLGPELERLLAFAGIRRERMTDLGLEFARRAVDGVTTYFIANWSESGIDGWIPLAAAGRSVAIYDPATGRSGFGAMRIAAGGVESYLQLMPGESRIVEVHAEPSRGRSWPYSRPRGGEATVLDGSWRISFEEGGPELPAERSVDRLGSWTELGDELARFSGTAAYRVTFPRPRSGAGAERWALDLGTVHESARVRVNGVELGTLLGPSYRLELDAALLRDENELEVRVSNLMANRISDLDRRGVFWKRFYNVNFPARLRENRNEHGLFDASGWEPLPSGLLGPVVLTPLETFTPGETD